MWGIDIFKLQKYMGSVMTIIKCNIFGKFEKKIMFRLNNLHGVLKKKTDEYRKWPSYEISGANFPLKLICMIVYCRNVIVYLYHIYNLTYSSQD